MSDHEEDIVLPAETASDLTYRNRFAPLGAEELRRQMAALLQTGGIDDFLTDQLKTAHHLLCKLEAGNLVATAELGRHLMDLITSLSDDIGNARREVDLIRAAVAVILDAHSMEEPDEMNDHEVVGQTIAFETPFLTVMSAAGGNWHWIEGKCANPASVVPIVGESFLLVELSRPSQGHRLTYEFPGGGSDPGETSRMAAQRELAEETGIDVDPDKLEALGHIRTNVGWLNHGIDAYVARVSEHDFAPTDTGEIHGAVLLSHGELREWIGKGRITDATTIALFAKIEAISSI